MQSNTQVLLTKYLDFGLSILPVHLQDGSVRPLIQKWQTESKITKENLTNYLHANSWGIVTGQLSGNLEAIDFDEKHQKGIYQKFLNKLSSEGKALIATLPFSTTKSGGYHILYRCKTIEGNLKLAKTVNGETIIETRGEGGFVFEYPTENYKFVNRLSMLHEITPEERDLLLNTARQCDESPVIIETKKTAIQINDPDNIFEEFNQSHTWEDILIPMGWKKVGNNGDEVFWQRPGKDDRSISATENYKGNGLFHVFTTSAGIANEQSYTKFKAYAHFEHQGDYKKARKAIVDKGYGRQSLTSDGQKQPESPQIAPRLNGDGLVFTRASDVTPKPVEWLWQGKIAKGKLSLIAGEPGLGKSQISVDIASIVSSGGKFPLANKTPESKVMMFSAEDGNADTIVPRLKACNAKMENVLLFSITMKQGKERYFDLKEDLPFLEEALKREENVGLITIDPITAFLGDTDSHVNAEVRGLLSGLSKLAEKYNIAIVVVTHLNKSTNSTTSNKVSGSVAFVAAVRSAFMVVKDSDNEDRRLFSTIKNNLAKDKTTLGFCIQEVNITPEIQTSRVEWEKVAIEMSANQILKEQGLSSGSSGKTVEWLENFLKNKKDGARMSEIERAGLNVGIGRRSIFNALKTAMVEAVPSGLKNEKIYRYAGMDEDIDPEDVPL